MLQTLRSTPTWANPLKTDLFISGMGAERVFTGQWLSVVMRRFIMMEQKQRRRSFSTGRSVMSFGDGSHGALGLPSSLIGIRGDAYEPTPVPGLPYDVSSVSAGHYHSLVVTTQGDVWCWGRNHEGQLGRGPSALRDSWNIPKRVEGLNQVKVQAAYASGVISTAIGDDGSLWVWGKSKHGQLGLGKGIIETLVPSRVESLAGEKIVKVSLGWAHALALTEDGKLFGWGYSADGRLGLNGKDLELSPMNPIAERELSSLKLEVTEKLVLKGIEMEKNMPIIWEPHLIEEVHGVGIVDVACGLDHSLVLCSNGNLLSGGSNIYGQLGRVVQDYGMHAVTTNFIPRSISSGLGHSLGICQVESSEVTGGATSIISWGWNQFFQLGRAGSEDCPLPVEGLAGETPVALSGGRAHSIALTRKGEVWVWGCGRNGRLGLGSSTDEVEPSMLECLKGYKVLEVASGFDHNLVIVSS